MIVFLGIVTSYEDWKHGRIRNKWLRLAILYAFFMMFLVVFLIAPSENAVFYMRDYTINLLISLSVGFILWHFGIWSAGDGKLFFTYATLVPLSVYSSGYVYWFPSMTILINTFLPVSLLLVTRMLISSGKGMKFMALKKAFNGEKLFTMATSLLGFSVLISVFLSATSVTLDGFNRIVLMFVFYVITGKVLGGRMREFSVVLAVFAIIIGYSYVFSVEFLSSFIIIFLIFSLVRVFFMQLSSEYFSMEMKIDDLKVGLFPAEIVYKKAGKYVKLESSSPKIRELKKDDMVFDSKRLSKKDLKKLKTLKSKGVTTVKVYKTTHFAIWMFAGVLLTIIFKGNILLALETFINIFII